MNKKTTFIVLAALVIGFGALIVVVQNYTDFFKRTDTAVRQEATEFDIIADQNIPKEKIVMSIVTFGGLCGPEIGCHSEIVILNDSTYMYQDVYSPLDFRELPKEKVENLIKRIQEADFEAIRSKKFTGVCPTEYDGQESIYTFYPMMEVIPSCEFAIDYDSPLFKQINEIVALIYEKIQ